MDCNGISNMLSAFLDEELGPEERRMVRQHLFGCAQCQNALKELKQLHRMLGSMESVLPPIDFAGELRREVMQSPVRMIRGSRLVPAGIWTLAAAAALACFFFVGSLIQLRQDLPQNVADEAPAVQMTADTPSEPQLFPMQSVSPASTLPPGPSISTMPPISAAPASSWGAAPAGQTLFDFPGFGEPVLFPLGR